MSDCVAYISPNGNILVLRKVNGQVHADIAAPVNRTKLLEFLLKNKVQEQQSSAILKFVESEAEAARSSNPGTAKPVKKPAATPKK